VVHLAGLPRVDQKVTIVDCPFDPCQARVNLVVEQADPGDDESTTHRVPPHATEPDNWFGLCPASLMTYPLEAAMIGPLREQAKVHGHMKATRDAQPRPASKPEPKRRAVPDARWFRPQTGNNPSGEASFPPGVPMEQVLLPPPPRMPIGYLPGSRPTEGESMATVSETKAAIHYANHMINEARQAARAASDLFTEALAVVDQIRATTVDTLGHAEVRAAIDSCDEALTKAQLAIEKNTTYGELL
jgi:hypothetical protein